MATIIKSINIPAAKATVFELGNIYVMMGAGAVIGAIAGGIIHKLKNR